MSEELENSVREMLKEETWTRAGITSFTITNLNELEEILKQAHDQGCENTIKDICDQAIADRRDSISALYLSGMIAVKSGSIDTSALENLIDIFEKNHKENLVENLCNSILSDESNSNNKFALKKLAEFYKNSNDNRVWETYEKIIKIDHEEADIAKLLAERYEEQGNEKEAEKFYRTALLRYISAKNYNAIKEIWTKLKNLIPEEIDFFLLAQRKIAKSISPEKSALLMQELYTYYKDEAKWDTAISILKLILEIDNKDSDARSELVSCYRGKYADNKNIDEYIRVSNLNQSFRNVFESINDFEKHIAFTPGNFVFHRSWGVGKITKLQGDVLSIFFGKKFGTKEITLKMAVSALQPLEKDHIWVLKATNKKETLVNMVKKDIPGILEKIIKSFDNNCDEKRIKAEIVPAILTTGEWTSWHAKAQKELASNPIFSVNPNNVNFYTVRRKMSIGARLSNEFKAEKQFFSRIDILMRYLDNDEAMQEEEYFADMFNYFAAYVKTFQSVTEQTVASYLVIQEVDARKVGFDNPAKFTFEDLYKEIENPREMYTLLKDTKNTHLKTNYLKNVRSITTDNLWQEYYINLFPTVLDKKMLDELAANGASDKLVKLTQTAFAEYRSYRNAVIYLFDKCSEEKWFKDANISFEKQLVTLVNIISQCYRESNSHVNTVENKKTIKNAVALLFARKNKDASSDDKTVNTMLNYMLENDVNTISRLYTMVNDVKDLEPIYKTQLRNGILTKYPEFKFQEAETKTEAPKGTLITAKKLDEKRKEAETIEKEKLPQIAQEIAEAKEKGDLKENAEYIAAREAQSVMSAKLNKLKDEIARAAIFDPTTITTSMVSFGTVVTLHDNINNTDFDRTILGPAESNADVGIISYLSPFAHSIMDLKVGESKKFSVNSVAYDVTVKAIVAAKF